MGEGEEDSECRKVFCGGNEKGQCGPFGLKLCGVGHSWVENLGKSLKVGNPW